MNKRYLLIIKNKYSIDTLSFYTIEEAISTAKFMNYGQSTIIDLENENIIVNNWEGEK